MSPATSIDEVLRRLEELERRFGPHDGVHWFNRLYLDVTRAVRSAVGDAHFRAAPFLERLDVYFGNRYFAAVDAADGHGTMDRAWKPLFDARRDSRIAPLQFALAGMNAHINHDLASGIVDTCEELGMSPGDAQHADYDSVNSVIKAIETKDKAWLLTGALDEIDHDVAPADDMAAVWSVERARDAAWVRGQVIWSLREEPELRAAYVAVNDRATELAGRAMLVPLS